MLNEFENSAASTGSSIALDHEERHIVRRQASEAVRTGQQAAALLRPMFSRMGSWQAETIKLETMVKRLKAAGHRDGAVEQQIRVLLETVSTERQRFEEALLAYPEKVVAHSRIRDARFCLKSIADKLQASLQ